MKRKLILILSVLLVIIGMGGIVFYDYYWQPVFLTEKVVVIKSNENLSENTTLTQEHVKIESISKKALPGEYVTDIDLVINQKLNVVATPKQIITIPMIENSQYDPNSNEAIFSINNKQVYAINGSLRVGDHVDIYLIKDSENEEQPSLSQTPYLSNVLVVHVRSEDNNDVFDTETGNDNNRKTSTSKIAFPEIKILKTDAQKVIQKIEEGYSLWVVRIE